MSLVRGSEGTLDIPHRNNILHNFNIRYALVNSGMTRTGLCEK